jgi:hypothetical protein
LIDSAPTALNTLKELANALGDDANYATTVQNQLATKANTTYVDEQFAIKTFPWFSSVSGYRYIDTGPVGLVLRAGTDTGMQILGTDNTPEEGKVLVYKGIDVINYPLTVNGVNVMSEISSKQSQLTSQIILSILRLICSQYVGTNEIRNNGAAQVTITDTCFVTGNLNVGGDVLTNQVRANGASQVTVNDHLNVTGNTTLEGTLTCGDITADNLLGNAAIQIQNYINTSISNYNPFWVSGRVNGTTLQILKSNGKYGFTVTRPSGFATGVYRIAFNTATPDANYVISLAQLGIGNVKVWESTDVAGRLPTTSSFHVVTSNSTWTLTNYDFYFSVFV